ncbi:hypothetical protein CDD83_8069 [Cordyceps sp. RAO-2017]|nr:hypothetical protein CDD83_8069 [Cordyceps sp. RAO-2017]
MFSHAFSATAVALALSSLASAQTSTECNPLLKDCPADPALGTTVTCDFTTKGDCSAFKNAAGTDLAYSGKGAEFKITKEADSPTLHANKFIFFGRVDVELQASPGVGIVTSVVLQSHDLDEIDWEWLGGKDGEVQTNYFSKGSTVTYDRSITYPLSRVTTQTRTYSIEWTSQNITWAVIDGNGPRNVLRTLTYQDAKGGSTYPQTPMQVRVGSWVGGRQDGNKGTIEWAGGVADFKNAPYSAYYKKITIVDYAGKDGPANGGVKEYRYSDKTGSMKSIEVVKGESVSDEKASEENGSKNAKDTGSNSHNEDKTLIEANKSASATPTPTDSLGSDATPTPTDSLGSDATPAHSLSDVEPQTTVATTLSAGSNRTTFPSASGGGASSPSGSRPDNTAVPAVPAAAPRFAAAAYVSVLLATVAAVVGQLLL